MLDVSHIPGSTNSTQIFYASGATTWQTWQKPRGAKFIQIFCLGGGGGGAGGGLNVAGTAINAGAGGIGAGYSRCIYPTFPLPDTLYVQVGLGGVPGTGSATNNSNGQTGGSGGVSYVAIAPSILTATILAQSMNAVSPGGNGNGNATSAPAVWTATSASAALGIISTTIGIAGLAQNTAGTTALTASLITQGCGGGSKPANSQNAGGSIFSASVILTNTLPGGVAGGGNGQNGYGSMSPFCGTGGSGGGGNLTGPGGRGGDGYYGCGGGGGGAGFSGSIGGRGGKGGDGLVIITTIF